MNKKLNKMNNHFYSPKLASTIAFVFAMGFCNLVMAQTPTVSVRLANPTYECLADQYCLDVEFQTDLDSVELFGMNVRFFYDDATMEFDTFTDFQGGYGPVSPDPPTVQQSMPGFGSTFFGFPAPGVADWVNGAIQLVDGSQPIIYIDTNGWTKIFQICFNVDGPIADSTSFCPSVVWDLELDPANGGYLTGDDGVVITVVADPMSGPSNENVVQYNWMYTGDGSAPPYGAPVENECVSLLCIPTLVCAPDVTLDCTQSTDPLNTGTSTVLSDCLVDVTISYSDTIDSQNQLCAHTYIITRTWLAVNACNFSDTCVQLISVLDTDGPTITCPPDIIIECDESTDPSNTGQATATDLCDTLPTVTYIDITVAGDCPQEYTIDRIWTATDDCGNNNFDLCRQRITIMDSTPPTIDCPADLTLECTDVVPTDLPTATDNCSTNLTTTYSDIMCDNPVMGFTGLYDISLWDTLAPMGGEVTPMGNMQVMLEGPDGPTPCPMGASVLFQIVIPSTGQLVFDWDYISADVDGEFFDPFGYNLNGTFFQLTDDTGGAIQSGTATVQVTAGDVFAFEQRSIDCILGSGATTVVEFFACVENLDPVCNSLIIRSHTVTDECGNAANCIQTIYIEDTTAPSLVCPPSLTIECTESTDVVDTGMATATDNCDADLVVTYNDVITPSSVCPQEYAIARTWTATDNCGNTTTCVQDILVDDSTPPIITSCPANVTIECDESTDPVDTGIATATDNCDTAPVVTYSDAIAPGACPQEYILTRTWTATDACGNATNCIQVVTVDDSTPPTITLCPADVTLECDESTDPVDTGLATATDNCDTAPVVTYNDSVAPGACPQESTISRTWTATDACGNSSTCLQTLVVEDTTPPALVCPDDITVECDESTEPGNVGMASATDNCDTAPVVTYDDSVAPGACPQESTITRTWTATDACGNSTTCQQTIVVDDSTPPVILCPDDLTLECTDPIPTDLATATDNCSSTITITYSDVQCDNPTMGFTGPYDFSFWNTIIPMQGGSVTTMSDNEVMLEGPDGSSCIDASVQFSIVIPSTGHIVFDWNYTTNDVDGPNFDPFGYNLNGTFFQLTDDSGADTQGGSISVAVTAGDVFAFEQQSSDCALGEGATTVVEFFACIDQMEETCTELIIRTHTATDECGNESNCVQTLFIEDTTPPSLTCPDDIIIECDASTLPDNTGLATATDNCDTTPEITYTDVTIGSQICAAEYTINRTWTATDACGNSTNCVQIITVDDSTPPVITCPDDITIECDESTDPLDTGLATATDNCDAAPVVTYNDSVAPGTCPQESTISRTWTATDACGNSSTCLQTIVVEDTTPPTIFCPGDITLECTDNTTPDAIGEASATDNCDTAPIVTYNDAVEPGTCPQEAIISRTWTATDACGNSSTCLQTITVDDSVAPTITTCAPDITIECDESTDPANTGLTSATDNCDPAPVVTYSDSVAPGACPQESTITRTWTATDACGNSTTCQQTIVVEDTTPPTLVCAPSITIECDESTDPLNTGLSTATDNCDPAPVVTYSDVTTQGACPQEYTIVRVWTVTDACGNGTNCTQVITVEDTTAPTFTECPIEIRVECDESTDPDNTGLASATDNCDPAPVVTYDDSTVAGNCPQEYSITRTWIATDACGNTSTCEQLIFVEDTTPPVITSCPSDITVECDVELTEGITGLASATDNCDPAPVVTYSDSVEPGACPQESTITRTWIATDACGNSSTCLQVIEIDDSTPPVIVCPEDLTLECTDPIPTDLATATDNCSETVTVTYNDVQCDNPTMGFTGPYDFSFWTTIIPVEGGSVTMMGDNEVMLVSPDITISCDDAAVQFSIVIPSNGQVVFDWNYTTNDVDGPSFDPFGYRLNGTFFQLSDDDGADTQGGTVSVVVTAGDVFAFEQQSTDCIAGEGATAVVEFFACIDQMEETCTELIIRTHTATDECGNESNCVQTIFIEDTTPPALTCPDDITIECDASTEPINTGLATATDNCDTTPEITYSDAISGSQVCIYEYTITRSWTATDACGNSTNCVQIITVDDSTPPVITCPDDVTIECTEDTSPESNGFASATDNCSDLVIVTSDDVTIEGACPQEYTITRTWTAQDECGNSSTCVQTIVVDDSTPPEVTCPDDITIDCNDSSDPENTGFASATDNCYGGGEGGLEVDYSDITIEDGCPEIIERTWTAVDACGNVGTCVQTITIDDTEAPAIICPEDVTVECASEEPPILTGGVTVSDNCGFVTVTHVDDIVTDSLCVNQYTISRIYLATDECGNTATCAQNIVVDDQTPPSITCPEDITVTCDLDVPDPDITSVTATDNCIDPVTITHGGDVITSEICADQYTMVRTYIATDACGNSATCAQTITVFDDVPPTVTCPANVTVSCASEVPLVNTGAVITSDNCGGTVTVEHLGDTITNMTCANRFTVTRTYNATDACGNSATCVQIITVFDNTPPVITCPPNITVQPGDSTAPMATGNPTGSDNCGGVPTFTFVDATVAGPCPEEFFINRTWTATDACGLTSTCVQEIFVDGDCILDLSLTKELISPAEVDGGDNVVFEITVLNEGETTVGEVVITDYIPLGFTLNDTDWTPGTEGSTGQSASISLSVANGGLDANGLNPGEFVTVQITLLADLDIAPGLYINTAEITFIYDINGNDISDQDIDSDPDDDDTNDPDGEDDIDFAEICVLPDPIITGDGYVCPGEVTTYFVTEYNADFTYEWILSGGGTIIEDNGSNIVVEWQEEPGGPFEIRVNVILGDNCNTYAFFNVYIQGVETLACNDLVQVSLGEDCTSQILSGMILEGEAEGNNNYYVIITDANGNVIPDATLTSEHIGECFTVTVVNECDAQSCWGTICVEDKIPPVIECTDVTVSCGSSLEPVFAPPVTGTAVESVNSGLPIGPNGGTVTTQEFILDVPANAIVTDVDITIDLDHTWVGDLRVELVSPAGTTVLLANQLCGAVDNWDNVTFDDEAGIAVTTACNPIPPALAGSVIPQEALAAFIAQSAVGTWSLVITDQVGGDGGTLNIVSLEVDYYLAVPSAPFASDACGEVELTYTDSESGDACEELVLTRTWTATDGSGNTASCVQLITITPLTLDNVDFPPAYEGVCGESILPEYTGWPTVDGTPITDENDLCNIFVGYWDKELNECGGGRKIVRTWTVLDWCEVELVEAVQVIKLVDNIGPELTCPEDFEVGTDFWYCYANVSVPKPIAFDECSEIESYSLSSTSGIIVSFGNNFVINGLLIGTHTVTWTVTDECGNSSTCSFEITVVDDVVPVALCDEHTIVSLTNDGPSGVTLVPASVFDDGSYDNCGPVTFRARRMDSCIEFDWTTEGACIDDVPGGIPPVNSRDRGTVHRPCVPFACCDVGAGPIMVELEVTDAAGNVNYCMIEAIVQDKISPFVECPPDIIVSCDFWFNVQEGTFEDGAGNNNGSLDEDPLSAVFGNMYDAFRYDESIRSQIIINDPSNDDYPQPYNWGIDGWADDNCEVNLQVRVRVIDDCSGDDLPGNAPDGAVKLIERRFSASDGNEGIAPGTCTQRIWVVDFDPFYITDNTCNNSNPQDGVIWPCDVLLTTCPEDLGNTGEPTIFDDACSLIGVTYEDTRFDFVDGACFKILREWAVIDWCQYDPQTGAGLWHYTQVIKVHDEEGPVFVEPCETVVLCVADEGVSLPDNNQAFLGEDDPLSSSCSVHLNLSRTVHETCSDVVEYDVKIYPFNGTEYILIKATSTATVDENNDAVLTFDTRQSTIQAIRLNGLPYNSQFCGDYHRILWSVEDGCGNWSHCEYLFRLEDCKQPSPVCINGLSTVVMPIGGEVTVWAKDFNASSFDDCTPSDELLYSFSGDTYTPSYTYDCENVPAFNVELSEEIWVADGGTDDNCNGIIEWSERNKDFCTTTIVITDNNNVCGGSGSVLAGEIFTDHSDAVAQVNVTLTSPGHFFPQLVTAQDGQYAFLSVPLGDDYMITPERNDAHRNGVSTLDLVRIQKHLLGKELFTSPYQYIAADANNTQTISAIDLVEIRKLILGIYSEFPANKSWRFVDKGFPMDEEHPWPFNENIELLQLADDSVMHNDFIGVKIGDVNNSVQANSNQVLPRNGRRVLSVVMDAAAEVKAGELIDVTLSIPEAVDGFQWTLETEGLSYEGISSETMTITDSHVGVLSDGVVTMSWNTEGEDNTGNSQVMHLQFVALTSGNISEMIRLTSKVTEAEAYTTEGEILDVRLSRTGEAAEFALYQNNPNPWNVQTTIGFDLPADDAVTFTVFEATGKVVKTITGDYKAGYNTITLDARELPTTGVMYYRLESGEYSASKKMVMIK